MCTLLHYQVRGVYYIIRRKLLQYQAASLLHYRAMLLHYQAVITLSGVFVTLSGSYYNNRRLLYYRIDALIR